MSHLVNLFEIFNKTLLKTQMTIFPIISCMSHCELSTPFTQALKKNFLLGWTLPVVSIRGCTPEP